jgi:glycine/D-amino acid oxidase-like deaminating enzyme
MRNEPMVTEVVVVGGGIVGAAASAFLADAGAGVTLVEREGLASGASGANQGIVQLPFDPALEPLYRETVELYRALSETDAGFSLPRAPTGMLFLSPDEGVVRGQAASMREAFPDLGVEVVGGAELSALEPSVAEGVWACRTDIGYPVAPGASTYAYASLAERNGAVIRQGRGAALVMEGDRVVGVTVGERRIAADAVLVAAGPWTPEVIDPGGRWRPIRPRWGVIVEAALADPPRYLMEEAGIESTLAGEEEGPEQEFSLVAGANTSAVGSTFLEREPDPAAWVEPILQRATRFVPSVADAPIRDVRACARPQGEDGRPLIGRVPGVDGLFVCAGHGPWGISTGPASARLVVDLILGRDPVIPPELDPARFPING